MLNYDFLTNTSYFYDFVAFYNRNKNKLLW